MSSLTRLARVGTSTSSTYTYFSASVVAAAISSAKACFPAVMHGMDSSMSSRSSAVQQTRARPAVPAAGSVAELVHRGSRTPASASPETRMASWSTTFGTCRTMTSKLVRHMYCSEAPPLELSVELEELKP